jgi:Secretion system C-terminal sorting domain
VVTIIKVNITELKAKIFDYEADPEFWGSQLESFFYNNIYNYSDIPECAEVIFCRSTFDIFYTNFFLIEPDDCPPIYIASSEASCPIQGVCNLEEGECGLGMCYDMNGQTIVQYCGNYPMYGTLINTCELPLSFGLTGGGSVNRYKKRLSYPASGSQFIDFSKTFLLDKLSPDGIIDVLGTRKHVEIAPGITESYEDLPNIDYLIRETYNANDNTFIEDTKNDGEYLIRHNSRTRDWDISIQSDSLGIQYFDMIDSVYVVGGVYQNWLKLDGLNLSNTSGIGGFLIYIKKDGTIDQYHTFDGLDSRNPITFYRTKDRVEVLARKRPGSSVTSDGVVYQNGQGNMIFMASDATNSISSDVRSETLTPDQALIGFSASDATQKTILYIEKANSETEVDSMTFRSTNANGILSWKKTFAATGVNQRDIKITHLGGDSLFAALTFSGTLQLGSNTFTSAGNEDVLLLFFDETGEIIQTLQYGTPEMENVSDVFVTDHTIYFAGEFEGSAERQLGLVSFYASNYSVANPYMTYIPRKIGSESFNRNDSNDQSKTSSDYGFEVFPNPFNDKITLSVNAPSLHSILFVIEDIYGKVVYQKELNVVSGTNNFDIPMQQISSNGIYYVRIHSKFPELNQTKKIIGVRK